MYSNHDFQPFLNKNGIMSKTHQTINKVMIEVIKISFGFGNQSDIHICNNADIR